MRDDLTPEQELLLFLSRTNISGKEDKDIESFVLKHSTSIDYQKLLDLASLNQVTPLLYRNTRKFGDIPGHVLDFVEKAYFATLKSNVYHSREVLRIIRLMREAGIEAISLKGSLFSDVVLGDMGIYPTSDIDLLVRPRDLDSAKSVLVASGYSGNNLLSEEDQSQGSYHLSFSNEKYVVELHWNLVMRYFDASPDFWWEDVGLIEYEKTQLSVLAPERYLLYAIFHLFSHEFIPLRFFFLVSGIVNKYRNVIDWNKLLACAADLKMKRITLFTLKLVHEILGTDIPEEIANRRVYGYVYLKRFVMTGLFRGAKGAHLRMVFFTMLMDTHRDTARVLIRRIFPDLSEIRLRYGLPADSKKVYGYYLLNPFFMLFGKR